MEKLRSKLGISHNALAIGIMDSPATNRKVQRQFLSNFRIQNSEASEKELFRIVLISRILNLLSINITEQEIDQAMDNINSFDELCYYIITLDEKNNYLQTFLG